MEALEKLRNAIKNRNVGPVVGAGVSLAAAGLPNWGRLLESGVEYLNAHKRSLNLRAKDITALRKVSDAGKLIDGFALLQTLLGGAPESNYYQAFLTEQFADPKVTDSSVLVALRNFGARVIVTTNYDLLLRDHRVVPESEMATWQDPREIFSILRGGRGIIHLHGRYDLPESVILSVSDYARIVRDSGDSKTIAQALFYSGVLMFVGSSADGVSDPHLGAILKEFSLLQGPLLEKVTPHFLLAKGRLEGTEVIRLRKLGIEPISYGDAFSDLPKFINSLSQGSQISIQTQDIRSRLHNLRVAQTYGEVLLDVKTFINEVVYPGRKVRIAFVEKTELDGRPILRTEYLFPSKATHNIFSYPQTLAAWALIEGQIFGFSPDIDYLDRVCNFGLLRQLKKFERVRKLLVATNPELDPLLSEFLRPDEVVRKTNEETLKLSDLYQHWVGRQPEPHYTQFISVPVPIVDEIVGQKEPPEYGVINIDTLETEPLLTDEVRPLLKLTSDIVALGFEIVQKRLEGGKQ
jgi:hypothetical protein